MALMLLLDVIFSDVGTSSMGIVNVNLPTRARVHFQHLWGEPIIALVHVSSIWLIEVFDSSEYRVERGRCIGRRSTSSQTDPLLSALD